MQKGNEEKFVFEVISVDIDWDMDFENLIFGCRAKVKVRIGDRVKLGYATSKDGQVNAFDLALRKVLEEFYPEISEVKLTDYRVELIDRWKGTEAYVKVIMKVEWGEGKQAEMEAIGSDLVATSIDALSSAYNFAIADLISGKDSVLV